LRRLCAGCSARTEKLWPEVPDVSVVIVPDAAQGFFDSFASGHRGVGDKTECGSSLQANLTRDGSLESKSAGFESRQGPFGQRGHEDGGVAEIGVDAHVADREEGQTLVVVSQPFESVS
jgi:hypothetical protein